MLNPTVLREFNAAAETVDAATDAEQFVKFTGFVLDLTDGHSRYRDYQSSVEKAMSAWVEFVRTEVGEASGVMREGAATASRAMLVQMLEKAGGEVERVNDMNQRGAFSGGGGFFARLFGKS